MSPSFRKFPLIFAGITLLLPACTPRMITLTRSQLMMGHVPVNISIQIPSEEKKRALEASEQAYRLGRKLEVTISEFQASSDISCLNRNAGKRPCRVAPETLELLKKAIEISKRTDHAFDIRFASLTPAGRKGKIKIISNLAQAFLPNPDTQLGVSSIGKGFIVDKMLGVFRQQGFPRVLIDAGGDLMAGGGPWRVAIQVPEGVPGEFRGEQQIYDRAMGSSGLYEQGQHIFDPRTGEKVNRSGGITVSAENLTLASALGTGFFVLGENEMAKLLPRFPGIQVYWVTSDGEIRKYPFPPPERN